MSKPSIPSGMGLAKENPSSWIIRSDEYRDLLVSDASRPLVSGSCMCPSNALITSRNGNEGTRTRGDRLPTKVAMRSISASHVQSLDKL